MVASLRFSQNVPAYQKAILSRDLVVSLQDTSWGRSGGTFRGTLLLLWGYYPYGSHTTFLLVMSRILSKIIPLWFNGKITHNSPTTKFFGCFKFNEAYRLTKGALNSQIHQNTEKKFRVDIGSHNF